MCGLTYDAVVSSGSCAARGESHGPFQATLKPGSLSLSPDSLAPLIW
jgi:hypothetical protein